MDSFAPDGVSSKPPAIARVPVCLGFRANSGTCIEVCRIFFGAHHRSQAKTSCHPTQRTNPRY